MSNHIFSIMALVLFVVAAILAFVTDTSVDVILGVIAAGLASLMLENL